MVAVPYNGSEVRPPNPPVRVAVRYRTVRYDVRVRPDRQLRFPECVFENQKRDFGILNDFDVLSVFGNIAMSDVFQMFYMITDPCCVRVCNWFWYTMVL